MPETTIIRRSKIDEPGRLELGTPLSADELAKIPLFSSVSRKLLTDNSDVVVQRVYEKGDVICRQGDFGSTAFYILNGSCDVFITTPISHVETEEKRGLMGLVSKMGSFLRADSAKPRKESRPMPTHVRIDAPVDLPWGEFRATIGAGSLFGEMTCLNFYPRSATVVARETVVCLEMLRNILDLLYKSEPQALWRREKTRFLRDHPGQKFEKTRPQEGPIGTAYRERALKNHLQSFEPFSKLSEEFLELLRKNADIVTFEPGEVICRQGEIADEFYIIRIGFVRVSQTMPGGEMVVEYLSRGQHFGEIALLAKAEGKAAQRVATCAAIDHVEVVAISADDFTELIQKFPEVRRTLAAEAANRLRKNADQIALTHTMELGEFLDQGLIQAQSLLVLDLERCTRCDECVRACADSHEGVTRLIRDGLRFDHYLVATSCRSCLDPVCMIGCPVGSIRRNETREIVIEDWCIGCELCAKQCPYGNINMHPFEVDGGSKLFAGQTPLREARARLEPLPESFDITTMPEGMAYDARWGYLLYRGIPNEKNRKALREFCAEPSYQKAVDELLHAMETRISLPVLPDDFKPNKKLSNFVSYDQTEKTLVFRGVVTEEDKREYLEFSEDGNYKKAVEQAARRSYGKKAVVYKAATCDLCESVKQEPNCVYACPHEAAMRVDPRTFFKPVLKG